MALDLEPLLTKAEAAELLNVTVVRLDNWRWNGRGPEFIALEGREVRYSPTALQKYIQRHTRKPSVQAFMEERHGLVSSKA